MKVRGKSSLGDKVSIDMTPMIDCVFQLMAFFIMTYKVVTAEGDFSVKMPLGKSAATLDTATDTTVVVQLKAAAGGQLAGIGIPSANLSFGTDFNSLRQHFIGLVGTRASPEAGASDYQVELDCDYNLQYENVIRAVTAVSGYRQGDTVIKLIEKINFGKPHAPGS